MACSQFKTGLFQLNAPWGRAVIVPIRLLEEIMSFPDDQVSSREFVSMVSLPMFQRFGVGLKDREKVLQGKYTGAGGTGMGLADCV